MLTVALEFLSFAGSLHAATLMVPENYKKIQEAVDKAAPGDTIMVSAGSYNENIVINKPLSIKSGKGSAYTVIRPLVKKEPVLKISDTANVTVAGFTMTGSDIAGIQLLNARNVLLSGDMAKQNVNGIILSHSDNNTLTGNEAYLNSYYGIYLDASSGNKIIKNTADANNDKGIFLSHSDGNTIQDNVANRNRWNGIMLFSSHGNTVSDNSTIGNAYGIVTSNSNDNNMISNTTLPNIFIILPIVLIYLGVMSYLLQKTILRLMHRS